ncbi:hypothetical protein PO124_31620 [Bacillus licheniformis]|nr:hypothetical protein [Bacillus licheniformis]
MYARTRKEAAETVVTTETNSPTVVKTMGKGGYTDYYMRFESDASTYEIQLLKEDETIESG